MNTYQRTAISLAAAQAALLASGMALAQTTAPPAAPASAPDAKTQKIETVVVSGRRAALESAQKIKQNADEIVDSIVADDIGKLPDRSVTEVLQRIVGVTIDRTMAKNDPEHYSVEGSGVNIRGLSMVRSELNGRDTFSANGGRALNFEDVPPELMAGVDVYKSPSAKQIEGAIGGLVNLRTALPFDYAGFKAAVSADGTLSKLQDRWSPSASGLVSNRWTTDLGEIGVLLSMAKSKSRTRNDTVQVEPYFLIDANRDDASTERTVWAPRGMAWRTLEFERTREGLYGALQWRKDKLQSSLTFFHSKYRMDWNETANFGQAGTPYDLALKPGYVVDSNNVLQKGTLYNASGPFGSDWGAVNFGADTRYASRKSDTRDLAWHLTWKPTAQWTLSSDLQLIRSKTRANDYTVGTGILMDTQTLDLTGATPRLVYDSAFQSALLNPANNYWGFTMEYQEGSKAKSNVWRGDATYSFDHPVWDDISFGLRLTDRSADNTVNSIPGGQAWTRGYHWAAITQTWQRWWAINDLARLSDPRFSSGIYQHEFNGFFGGKVAMPSLLMPVPSLAQNGYPGEWKKLHDYAVAACGDIPGNNGSCPTWTGNYWTPSTYGEDPISKNFQQEKSQAAYAQANFHLDDWGLPVDGNVGLRLVRTDMTARGYSLFTIDTGIDAGAGETLGGAPMPKLAAFAAPIDYTGAYNNVLPSLNLRFKARSDLQFRFAWAQAIARPDFSQLMAYTNMKLAAADKTTDPVTKVVTVGRWDMTGESTGNPALKPIKSNQIDLTGEWYFSKNGSLTAALFNKQLKDVIVNQTAVSRLTGSDGSVYDFSVTSPVNGAKGHVRGVELAFQRYFDMLPGWLGGLGVQANYTYIDSKTKPYSPVTGTMCSGTSTDANNLQLNINGCDTDGRVFGNLPLVGISRNAYNLALLYDYGKFSARLAYSWRSKYLQGVKVNGTNGGNGRDAAGNGVAWALPTWNDDYGQLDGGVTYKVSDQFSVSLEGQNLRSAINRQLMQQQIGMMTRALFYTGPRYVVRASYSF